jgi:hypothetical protein
LIDLLSSHFIDSPYFESVAHGFSSRSGRAIRPAETNSYIVISKGPKHIAAYFVGPWEVATNLVYGGDTEIIWIRLGLGVHIKRTPAVRFKNSEFLLNSSLGNDICLYGENFNIPSFKDIDLFLGHLLRKGILVHDLHIKDAIESSSLDITPERSIRHRFLSSVGLSKRSIIQIQKAKKGAEMIANGIPIIDVAFSLGYYDQSHLHRSILKYIGRTPSRICRTESCRNVQDAGGLI